MADAIGNKAAKDYHLDIPAPEQGFFAKGLGHGDWGAKNRLSRLFNPKSGNTVMLAFDHGYIMGTRTPPPSPCWPAPISIRSVSPRSPKDMPFWGWVASVDLTVMEAILSA